MWKNLFERWRAWRQRMAVLKEPPRLVATLTQRLTWTDQNNLREDVTYLMFVDGRGRRTWRAHSYGWAKRNEREKTYSTDVVVWAAGGPLPKSNDTRVTEIISTPPGYARRVQITVIK